MKRTQAEIDHFSHPDQAWLQDLWEPAVGDWIQEPPYPGPTLIGDHRMLAQFEAMNFREWAVWLPTLSDLLGMIEEAGYDVLASSWTEDDERRYEYIGCERATVDTNWRSAWVYPGYASSWRLAAAELLRRVRDAN